MNLPPLPPLGVFDTRFIVPGFEGLLLNLREADDEVKIYNLSWQNETEEYPMTLCWDPDNLPGNGMFIISDAMGGVFIAAIDMRAQSELIIPDSLAFISEIVINAAFPSLGVEEPSETALPTVFDLKQNYPNPFNLSTVFRFDLPKETDISLRIYNVLGQRIITLADGVWPAGCKQIAWNGCDQSGIPISSGLYFFTIKAESYHESQKIMVIK